MRIRSLVRAGLAAIVGLSLLAMTQPAAAALCIWVWRDGWRQVCLP